MTLKNLEELQLNVTYRVRCTGTQAHMSVCSFHHDHALMKMLALLAALESIDNITYNVRYVKSGGEGLSAYELCEALIAFGIPADVSPQTLKQTFDALIKATGFDGFCYEIIM